jgi:chemotaxis methyl-accepting protein methylase
MFLRKSLDFSTHNVTSRYIVWDVSNIYLRGVLVYLTKLFQVWRLCHVSIRMTVNDELETIRKK